MDKVKNFFSAVGAFLTVIALTVVIFLLRRRNSDRSGSSGDAERDTRITEGIDRSKDTVEQCEEHLQRAEDILRRAIERSRQREQKN